MRMNQAFPRNKHQRCERYIERGYLIPQHDIPLERNLAYKALPQAELRFAVALFLFPIG